MLTGNPVTNTTLRYLTANGNYVQSVDSGSGTLYRPFAGAEPDSNVGTLETLYDYYINHVPDPARAKLINPNIYYQIRSHPDAVAAKRKREFTVASYPWQFLANPRAPDKITAQKVADYCRDCFTRIPAIHQTFREMQEAVVDGSRGHEWIWHREADGSERPVKANPIDRTRFVFDRLGNMALLTRFEPVWGAYVMGNPQQPIPMKGIPRGKFTYHIHMRSPGLWDDTNLEGYVYYGLGEDLALAYVLMFDTFVLRFRMKWLEKFGLPPTDVFYPDNMPQFVPTIRKIADAVRGESVCLIPKPVGQKLDHFFEVRTREVPKTSYDCFESFSESWTRPRIYQILLGDADESRSSDKGGYSDRTQRQDNGPQVVFKWDSMNISSTITEQLVPPMALMKFPNLPVEYFPLFSLAAKEERDRVQEGQLIQSAITYVPLAEAEVYERLGFRKPSIEEPTIGGLASAGQGAGQPGQPGQPGQQPPKPNPMQGNDPTNALPVPGAGPAGIMPGRLNGPIPRIGLDTAKPHVLRQPIGQPLNGKSQAIPVSHSKRF